MARFITGDNGGWFCEDRKVEDIVIQKLTETFPNNIQTILQEMKYSVCGGNYYFYMCDIYVGVEPSDGYIHS